ncbi:MAG: hypothetical protein EU541_06305, partial [Promethearchaeota archaeon]
MDTEYDFITPEFLHLLFFKQKNLIIYPHIDVKHLQGLETFTVGYTLIDVESTALYNLKDLLRTASEGNTPNFYLIYGLNKEKAKELLELERVHCILNVNESMTECISDADDSFVFFNKKTGKFLNYHFNEGELKFEHMMISLAKDPERVRTELLKIKNITERLYKGLNTNPDQIDVPMLFSDYNEEEYLKLFEFAANYYDINIPDEIMEQKPRFIQENSKQARFFEEFKAITSVNQKFTDELIKMLHTYKQTKVNPSNLELEELHTPMLLFNYLRQHHWNTGVPVKFLKKWVQMEHTKYQLTREDLDDFSIILGKIGIIKNERGEILDSIEIFENQ